MREYASVPARTVSSTSDTAPTIESGSARRLAVIDAALVESEPMRSRVAVAVARTPNFARLPEMTPFALAVPPSESATAVAAVSARAVESIVARAFTMYLRRPPSESTSRRNRSESLRSAASPSPPCAVSVPIADSTRSVSSCIAPAPNRIDAWPA